MPVIDFVPSDVCNDIIRYRSAPFKEPVLKVPVQIIVGYVATIIQLNVNFPKTAIMLLQQVIHPQVSLDLFMLEIVRIIRTKIMQNARTVPEMEHNLRFANVANALEFLKHLAVADENYVRKTFVPQLLLIPAANVPLYTHTLQQATHFTVKKALDALKAS
jgi:hypothetical protein